MSAPRKIWAASPKPECYFSARSFSDPNLPAHLYHHDDVVRELVEALEAVRDGYGPNHLSKFARDTAEAALAKIAQDG